MSAVLENTPVRPAVIPYYKERDSFPPNVLNLIYRKMVAQGLGREALHGHSVTEEGFVEHMDAGLTSIFLDLNGSFAGIAWLANVDEGETLRKAEASVMMFREYWQPQVSKAFGLICLSQFFNVLEMDMVYGITPVPNRLSRLFTTRLGFKQKAILPGFVSYKGQTVDAIYSAITRVEFNKE